jgi:hypothetical protein
MLGGCASYVVVDEINVDEINVVEAICEEMHVMVDFLCAG